MSGSSFCDDQSRLRETKIQKVILVVINNKVKKIIDFLVNV